jgi:hypothetical protein
MSAGAAPANRAALAGRKLRACAGQVARANKTQYPTFKSEVRAFNSAASMFHVSRVRDWLFDAQWHSLRRGWIPTSNYVNCQQRETDSRFPASWEMGVESTSTIRDSAKEWNGSLAAFRNPVLV